MCQQLYFLCYYHVIYFSPVLEGKKLDNKIRRQFIGMSKEIVDHRAEYDEEPLWTNSMFGGMPAYQISVKYKKNLISHFQLFFKLYLKALLVQCFFIF